MSEEVLFVLVSGEIEQPFCDPEAVIAERLCFLGCIYDRIGVATGPI